MLRKLCHHTLILRSRQTLLRNVRVHKFSFAFLHCASRLRTDREQQGLLKLGSCSRTFSDFPSSFKDRNDFEVKCEETLDSLAEYFEELVENTDHLDKADVNYADGVLTVQFGEPYGTYVINRQSPNCQIWLSSPSSGPKRYDFRNGEWVYAHDGVSLHDLLNKEISEITKKSLNFRNCAYGRR